VVYVCYTGEAGVRTTAHFPGEVTHDQRIETFENPNLTTVVQDQYGTSTGPVQHPLRRLKEELRPNNNPGQIFRSCRNPQDESFRINRINC
jgi:hypothetical protein